MRTSPKDAKTRAQTTAGAWALFTLAVLWLAFWTGFAETALHARAVGQFSNDWFEGFVTALFAGCLYGSAIAIPSAVGFWLLWLLWRYSLLGDGARALLGRISHTRPQTITAISVALACFIILVFVATDLALEGLSSALATRKRFDLSLLSTAVVTVIVLILSALVAGVLGKGIAWAMQKIPHPRGWRAAMLTPLLWVLPLLTLVGCLAFFVFTNPHDAKALRLWRPMTALLLAVVLASPCYLIAKRIAKSERRLALVPAMTTAGLVVGMLSLGSRSYAVKSTVAVHGFGPMAIKFIHRMTDLDRDGYSSVIGGGDCDDLDASIYPGAPERPGDGIDQNCIGGDPSGEAKPVSLEFIPAPAKPKNIILITIDTIRADHLGSYGYNKPTTPHLDALAKDGSVFTNAWAHAPSTRYSIPAILTGKLPLRVPYDTSVTGWPGIKKSAVTLAEIAKKKGYDTGAIVNYWYFDTVRSMNQGFNHYDNSNKRLHRGVPGEGPAHTRGSSSRQQSDKAIEFINQRADKPFFLWVHYYDPHYEYEAHAGSPNFGDGKIARYDQEIWFTDKHIGRVIDTLKQQGAYDDTLFIVTGDHGEGFGEHGIDLHGYHLYAAQTKVPLIIKGIGAAGQRLSQPAAHADILPTLANLVGESAETVKSDGVSLLRPLLGQQLARKFVYQQLSFENNNEQRGAIGDGCHVIYYVSPHSSWESYELRADPNETTDRYGRSDGCGSTERALARFYDQSRVPKGAAAALQSKMPTLLKPLYVTVSEGFTLHQALLPTRAKPGEEITLGVILSAQSNILRDWRMFVHFERDDKLSFSGDHAPARPSGWWRKGDIIAYDHPIQLPNRSGTYTVWAGFFRKGARATLTSSRNKIVDNRVQIGTIRVGR